MDSNEIRREFLAFFEKRGHRVYPSSSLVPEDPTILLTTAGMVQFKPFFSGERKPKDRRLASAQKCLRTTDVDEVGRTARHLTFFEMLGNFSLGDYYKEEAIGWAWEFVTDVFKLDPERFWVSVFHDDDEAAAIWQDEIGIPESRLLRLGEEDNFWSAGPTGPCGSCSELLYDQGKEFGCDLATCGSPTCECDRFLELWNLVFMAYDRDEKGKLHPLPQKNIDTGMGLERAAAILQGARTNFETDLLEPILEKLQELSGVKYGASDRTDVSLKIVTDHVRAITFLVGDGVLPGNVGRGYVLRRLLRRAVRHGRLVGLEEAFLSKLIVIVIKLMSGTYPELKENRDFILNIAESEEERFSQTLKQGLAIMKDIVAKVKSRGDTAVNGDVAFQLYDTYGFPLELTRELAAEEGLAVEEESFQNLMVEQREKARAAWTGEALKEKEIYQEIAEQYGQGEFAGYDSDEVEGEIKVMVRGEIAVTEIKNGEEAEVIVDQTPFYAEMGGQVGDTGTFESESGKFEVKDTKLPHEGLYIHRGRVVSGELVVGQKVKGTVDAARRQAIQRYHTATHLLHWALRLVLGSHVKQAGSLVAPDRLRFDFTHGGPLSHGEIQKIEKLVNVKVFEDHPVRAYQTTFDFARESGAIALFGEKYNQFVRVVELGNFSKELCGGTHVSHTGQIGLVKITTEEGIGANTRRLEAATWQEAWDYLQDEESILRKAASTLKVEPREVPNRIEGLIGDIKSQKREVELLQSELISSQVESLLEDVSWSDKTAVIIREVDAPNMDILLLYADRLREKLGSLVLFLAAIHEKKVLLLASATPDVAQRVSADALVKVAGPLVGGGGGGRAELAQAGGRRPEGLPDALKEVQKHVEDVLGK